MEVRLTRRVAEHVREAGRRAYPAECCGVLIGPPESGDGGRRVVRAVACRNAAGGSRSFALDAGELRALEAEAEAAGLALLGVYHSHPDVPAAPSRADLEHAWPWLSYVILGVERGRPARLRAWRLEDDGSGFREELIAIEEERP